MNSTIQDLGPCKKMVRITVDAEQVNAEFDKVTSLYAKHAKLPGFRPGKTPKAVVRKNYAEDIKEETKRNLVNEGYKQALDEHSFKVVGQPDLEEIEFSTETGFSFALTMELEPDFELPDYKGLKAKVERVEVSEDQIDEALNRLCENRPIFDPVKGEIKKDAWVQVKFRGTIDDTPIENIDKKNKQIGSQKEAWTQAGGMGVVPGLADALIGHSKGDKITHETTFPEDFISSKLRGQTAVYRVEVLDVAERRVPEMNDEMARLYGAESLEGLRDGVKKDIENEGQHNQKQVVRNQLIQDLLTRVSFELPEDVLNNETKRSVYDMVQNGAKQGLSEDQMNEQKDAIFQAAQEGAKQRLKGNFVLSRIAEKESITATNEELSRYISMMAYQQGTKPELLVRRLRENNQIAEVSEQIVVGKVLDLLQLHAEIEEVAPGSLAPAPEESPEEGPGPEEAAAEESAKAAAEAGDEADEEKK